LYDNGYRREDFTILYGGVPQSLANFKDDPELYAKRAHWIEGLITFAQPFFVGEIGGAFIGMNLGIYGAFPHPYA
jgi:hypothetical protein